MIESEHQEPRLIVCDTGPLISLEKLANGYQFIRLLFDTLIVPPAVLEEVSQGEFTNTERYLNYYKINDLIQRRDVTDISTSIPQAERLHLGELQAIQLAKSLNLPLLIEEAAGREIAQQLDIPISGIAGQIIKGYRQSILTYTKTTHY